MTGDTFTRNGARRLAQIITEYWANRGRIVNCTIENIGAQHDKFEDITIMRCWSVRSDMVNGLPAG